MPKGLCITALVIAILVFILFFVDMTVGYFGGQHAIAPFKGASLVIDIIFCVAAVILGLLAWTTFREQK